MNGCIYQTAEERCLKFSNGKSQSWCVGKGEPCGYRKPSHSDLMRDMTDEQLADFHVGMGCPPGDDLYEECTEGQTTPPVCHKCWLNWLAQEASE